MQEDTKDHKLTISKEGVELIKIDYSFEKLDNVDKHKAYKFIQEWAEIKLNKLKSNERD